MSKTGYIADGSFSISSIACGWYYMLMVNYFTFVLTYDIIFDVLTGRDFR